MKFDRVSNLTKEEFIENYLIPNKPVIITDAMDNWDISKFQPSGLKENYGDMLVQVYNDLFELQTIKTLEQYFDDNFDKPDNEERSKEYVRWYTKLKEVDFFWGDEIFEKLKPHWTHPYFLPDDSIAIPYCNGGGKKLRSTDSRFPYRGLFVSGKGARTRLHRDPFNSNAILCQFYGEKEVYLFGPEETENVMNGTEFVDVYNPNYDKFPNYNKDAYKYKDVLKPGEVIFLCAGWFHDVTSISDSISITWNFVHSLELDNFYSFLKSHPNDPELDTIRYFLKDLVTPEANVEEIIIVLKEKFPVNTSV